MPGIIYSVVCPLVPLSERKRWQAGLQWTERGRGLKCSHDLVQQKWHISLGLSTCGSVGADGTLAGEMK